MNNTFTALGDMHGGKQTVLVHSDTDLYILKPRSSENEEAFDLFCKKLNELGIEVFSRAPHIIKSGDVEHTQRVEKNEKTDENGANLYYKRAGVLLFFTYLLGSIDLHCENLIANGDMPVIVDLETLLTGKPRGTIDTYNLSQSVMRSHLLCNFMCTETTLADVSGFCGVTSQMQNIPYTEEGRIFPWDKKNVFINGFESAYLFSVKHKAELSTLLHIFDRCKFRQILRPTKTYCAISAFLSKINDDKTAIAEALLSKAYKNDIDKNRFDEVQLVLQNEVDAVLKNEIPLFYSYGNETSLYCNGQKVLDGHLVLSPVDYALSRLEALSNEDLARQMSIINLAIDASTPIDKVQSAPYVNAGALSAGEITAAEVSSCAVDGLNSVFCSLQSDTHGNVDFISCNYSLYHGLCGILCMYASLLRKTEKTIYKDHLYRYYEKVRRVFFNNDLRITVTDKNSSLSDGITGILSCIEHIGRLTEDTSFINDARAIAERLDISKSIANTDYLNGCGALLPVLQKLNCNISDSVSSILSPIFKSSVPFTTGTAHGAGGLCISLCALNLTESSHQFDEKIFSLLKWENEHYSAKNNNWFDLRDKSKKGFMSGWCSGAPGIGMARSYIRKNTSNTQLIELCEADENKVKIFLSEMTEFKKDTLCCGTASALMSASFLGIAVDRLYNNLHSSEINNKLRVSHIANTYDKNVSLMQGLSGIAYALSMYGDPLCGGMII